jgi:5-methylcytosine-specific restriction endonuclease McrA
MNRQTPKRPRLRLEAEDYRQLRLQILERDGWRCQHCGRRDQLQVHHIVSRSQLGADSGENLILLCADCHRSTHRRPGPPAEDSGC